jgi:hypothetical protein
MSAPIPFAPDQYPPKGAKLCVTVARELNLDASEANTHLWNLGFKPTVRYDVTGKAYRFWCKDAIESLRKWLTSETPVQRLEAETLLRQLDDGKLPRVIEFMHTL